MIDHVEFRLDFNAAIFNCGRRREGCQALPKITHFPQGSVVGKAVKLYQAVHHGSPELSDKFRPDHELVRCGPTGCRFPRSLGFGHIAYIMRLRALLFKAASAAGV
jgi:hypothetical protein